VEIIVVKNKINKSSKRWRFFSLS